MRMRVCVIAFTACGGIVLGCNSGSESAEYRRQIAAESLALERSPDTTYRRRMREFTARVRAVPMDSLAKMFTRLAHATREEQPALRQAITCEYVRMMTVYGTDLFERAKARMDDSLERAGVDLALSKQNLDAGAGPPLEISERACPGLPEEKPLDSLQIAPKPSFRHE